MPLPQNVGNQERVVSAAAGGFLLLSAPGLSRTAGIASVVTGGALLFRAASGYCPLYAALGFDPPNSEARRVDAAQVHVTVGPHGAYQFIRLPRNLSRFLSWVEDVDEIDNVSAKWRIAGASKKARLPMSLTQDVAGRRLQWRSHPDVPFTVELTLELLDEGERGTVIAGTWLTEQINLAPKRWTHALAHSSLRSALSKLKQLIETGEISTAR